MSLGYAIVCADPSNMAHSFRKPRAVLCLGCFRQSVKACLQVDLAVLPADCMLNSAALMTSGSPTDEPLTVLTPG